MKTHNPEEEEFERFVTFIQERLGFTFLAGQKELLRAKCLKREDLTDADLRPRNVFVLESETWTV